MTDSERYAVYFVPAPQVALAERGGRWLGYDIELGTNFVPSAFDGLLQERWAEITRAPRHYGFHATLKPPFRLAEGCSATALAGMMAALAKGLKRVTIPRLSVGAIGDFVALVPDADVPYLSDIAAACVRSLDSFRAPLDDAEIDRFLDGTLSDRQAALLGDWGYPYVLDEYRFHMTLSGPLSMAERPDLINLLRDWFDEALQGPVGLDALALVHQPDPAAPFRVQARFPLAGALSLDRKSL